MEIGVHVQTQSLRDLSDNQQGDLRRFSFTSKLTSGYGGDSEL